MTNSSGHVDGSTGTVVPADTGACTVVEHDMAGSDPSTAENLHQDLESDAGRMTGGD